MSDSDRSIPPLDEHLKSIDVNKTRMGRVYDWLIGRFLDGHPPEDDEQWNEDECIVRCLVLSTLTSAYPELPNRKRLIELVERAMPQPVRHETTETKP